MYNKKKVVRKYSVLFKQNIFMQTVKHYTLYPSCLKTKEIISLLVILLFCKNAVENR